ncbi:immunoglobulin-like domain-containing protein [Clostridium sp.]|uniref:immunoglobulin-like domain-containing protein n=1 Tax=Clostridium sp. TaxID=1506 RepID=UPI002613C5BF
MKKSKILALILSSAMLTSIPKVNTLAKSNNDVNNKAIISDNIENLQDACITNKSGKLKVIDDKGNIIYIPTEGEMIKVYNQEGDKALVRLQRTGIKGYIDSSNVLTIKSGDINNITRMNRLGSIINVSSAVNVRKGPSMQNDVIDLLHNGTSIRITGKTEQWYRVNINGLKGFIFEEYIKEGQNSNINQEISSTPVEQNKVASNYEQDNDNKVNFSKTSNSSNQQITKSNNKPNKGQQQIKPVETQKPSKPENNGDHGHDVEVKPSKPEEKPVTPSKPENNGDNGHGEVVTPSKPEKLAKPVEQNKPIESTKPDKGDEHNKPVESDKPIQLEVINNVPTLTGHGVTIDEGTKFSTSMLNLKAHDNEDGDLTGKIQVVSNNINTSKPGDYTVTAKVSDSKGASIQKSFTVTVKKVIKPVIIDEAPTLIGHGVTIKEGTKFDISMLNLKASDKEDGDLTDKLQVVDNNVNTAKAGKYTVRVKVSDSKGASIAKSFTVIVEAKSVESVNEAPVITANDVTIEQGTPWTMAMSKVSATDKEDGNITSKVEAQGTVDCNKAGEYKVALTVKDSKGLTATKTITVTVKAKETQIPVKPENQAPVLNADNVTLIQGQEFNKSMLNIEATDKEEGNLTPKVVIDGTVDVNKVGEYTLTLTVKDSQGLTTTKKIIVTVKAKPNTAPTVNGKDITVEFGSKFDNSMLGVNVNDAEDKAEDIKVVYTGKVNTDKAGEYKVTVTATDTQGLSTSKTFTVTVKEKANTAPYLTGGHDVTIEQGSKFDNSMLEVKANDKEQGDLTSSIAYTGNVDVNNAGTYKVTATVVDAQGLKDSKTFTVTVKAKEVPPVEQYMEINSNQFQQMFRSKMLNKINEYRASKGTEPFNEDKLATQLSDIKVKDMCEYGYFDHRNPNTGTAVDSKWDKVLPDANLYLGASSENIYQSSAWNSTKKYTEKDVNVVVNDVFNAWKNSPLHNATMRSVDDTNFGISIRATDKYVVVSMDTYEPDAFE